MSTVVIPYYQVVPGSYRDFPEARFRVRLKAWKARKQSPLPWLWPQAPQPQPSFPYAPQPPVLPLRQASKCPRCGIDWSGPMGYVCPRPGCGPSFGTPGASAAQADAWRRGAIARRQTVAA